MPGSGSSTNCPSWTYIYVSAGKFWGQRVQILLKATSRVYILKKKKFKRGARGGHKNVLTKHWFYAPPPWKNSVSALVVCNYLCIEAFNEQGKSISDFLSLDGDKAFDYIESNLIPIVQYSIGYRRLTSTVCGIFERIWFWTWMEISGQCRHAT